ncbi:uncharacterized protein JN550_003726 [Neoarthrinium moseri]|uniref:uncharacterized protein n=1 Tax=Neoarthrinium moseri TaxID=1658444 RepID=UPI001FDBC34C|nr:uncharacterized protein JN550_003726 [Neoarthrinium moseri]KAI1872852.1 hypothetical protein JN550_003726 [Neoarthrinium moseri]
MSETSEDESPLAAVYPPVDICPHYQLCEQEVVYSEGRVSSRYLIDTEYKEEKISVSFGDLRPWIEVIAKLLLDSQIQRRLISAIMETYVPRKYHGTAELEDLSLRIRGEVEQEDSFHRFMELPAELRMKVWEFAATEPAHIIYWMEEPSCLPINGARHMPRIAQTCREAWKIVRGQGRYCQPSCGEGLDIKYWASSQDIVFIKGVDVYKKHPSDWDVEFLLSRETIAVEYEHWIQHAATAEQYMWLRNSSALRTLILVMNMPVVRITKDLHSSDLHCCGPVFDEVWDDYGRPPKGLWKLVRYEEADQLRQLDNLWKKIEPNSTWIWKDINTATLKGASIYGRHYISRCVDCELQQFQDERIEEARIVWRELVTSKSRQQAGDNSSVPPLLGKQSPRADDSIRQAPSFEASIILEVLST